MPNSNLSLYLKDRFHSLLSKLTTLIQHRRARFSLVLAGALFVGGVLGIYWDVRRQGAPIYHNVSAVPSMPVALVFGAGYSPHYGPSPVLYDRVAAGVELYKAGKVRKLLMSGDNHRIGYNEPEAMRQQALQMGVPDRDIVCDYAGFRTYDSLYRARDIFNVRQAVLVSQSYHLPRALFTARALDIEAVGLAAEKRDYGSAQRAWNARELLSIENAWLQARLTHPRPTFLGKKEPIFP